MPAITFLNGLSRICGYKHKCKQIRRLWSLYIQITNMTTDGRFIDQTGLYRCVDQNLSGRFLKVVHNVSWQRIPFGHNSDSRAMFSHTQLRPYLKNEDLFVMASWCYNVNLAVGTNTFWIIITMNCLEYFYHISSGSSVNQCGQI